jgi:hypothetical protein
MGANNPNLPSNVLSDEEAIQYLAGIVFAMRKGVYNALTGSPTATAVQMVGGTIEISGGTTATLTTDTAANIIAQMQALDANAAIGSTSWVNIVNDNSGALTVTGGTGVTVTGTSIPAAAAYRYLLTWSGANAVTMKRTG